MSSPPNTPHGTAESTIGLVHWGAVNVLGDGAQIIIEVPAFFEAHHVAYLTGVLESRLPDVFATDGLTVSLEPGELTRGPSGADYQPGRILIEGVTQPWPDARALREALEAAFVEAGEVEVRQRELGKDLLKHLRSARD